MQYNEEYKAVTFHAPKSLMKRVKKICLDQEVYLKDTITRLLIKWVAEQERRER